MDSRAPLPLTTPGPGAPPRERLGELFERAAPLPEAERTPFLEASCPDDAELRRELQSLLRASDASPDFLDRLAAEVLPAALLAVGRRAPEVVRPGQQVAHYRILGELGRGGMGVVYEAHDGRLDRRVALKFLPAHLAADANARERLTSEARVASALDHPNICTIYDIGELDGGRVFIALARYDGETLRQRIRRGPLAVDQVVALARQLVDGLAAAHRRGIVHRDVKPANVMITPEGVAKILDFGIAKARDVDPAGRAAVAGTVAYMSPEQTRGAEVDARTDIWSVGVVLYEMLTGMRPFPGASDAEVMARIRAGAPVSVRQHRAEVPEALAGLVTRCLETDPADRYQRADELLAELRALETPDPTVPQRTPIRRLAVLPLSASDGEPDDDGLAEGATDELIGRLSSVGGVRVTARASAARFGGDERSPSGIGRVLGVDAIVDGAIARTGEGVRISLQVVDVATAQRIWSSEQAIGLDALPGVLRATAWQIVGALDVHVRASERRQLARQGTEDAAAFALYLRGRHLWSKRDRESLQQARDCFQRALDRDPGYPQAWTGLADTFSVLGSYLMLPPVEAYPRARGAAEKALALDDELAAAHASLATTFADHYWDWEAAERHFRSALALNPSYATAHLWYAGLLRDHARFDEALGEVRRARELDPLSPATQAAEGITLYVARRYDEAIALLERLLVVSPEFVYAHFLLALSLVQQRRHADALRSLRAAERWSGAMAGVRSLTGHVRALLGDDAGARAMLDALEDLPGGQHAPGFEAAVIHVALGEHDRALALLQRACDARSKQVRLLGIEPLLDPLRTDARFTALLAQVGLRHAPPGAVGAG